jgi:hypothetical protein
MKIIKIIKICGIALVTILVVIILAIFVLLKYTGFSSNNMTGIEKTLKRIYNIDTSWVPHESDVVSVNVSLDRNYTTYKLVLNIILTNDRNIIIRDFNGNLKSMNLQKIGGYELEAYYFYPEEMDEEDKYYWSFQGIDIRDFNKLSEIKIKSIDDMIKDYNLIYEFIETLPEIYDEIDNENKSKRIIYINDEKIYLDYVNNKNYYDKLFDKNNGLNIINEKIGQFIIFKKKWSQKDEENFTRRIKTGY